MRRRAAAALVAAAVGLGVLGVPVATAVVTGVSDGSPAFFDSPYYRALDLHTVRLVVPWDAGLRSGPWDAWLARAAADGADVMVALGHDEHSRCPDDPCALPSDARYGQALDALLAHHPEIRRVVPWNEPNHATQPTFRDPEGAAHLYAIARRHCPGCTVVAGNFLDDAALPGYLARYQAALDEAPAVWGLHNYYDSTYFASSGVDLMLRRTTGALWLTETGGIVAFTPPGAPGTPYAEERAADSVRWLYALAAGRPRVERMYLYQWQGDPFNDFDSGLLGYAGTPRPGYAVVAAHVGPRDGTGTGAEDPGPTAHPSDRRSATRPQVSADAPHWRLVGRRLRLFAGGRLELRLRCVAPLGARCRSLLVLRVGGRIERRLTGDVRGGGELRRVVRLGHRAWRTLAHARVRVRAVELQACATQRRCTARTRLPVSAPRHAARG